MGDCALIGLDWGTTNLRAFLFADSGEVLETRSSAQGAAKISRHYGANSDKRANGFSEAFAELCGDWVSAQGELPVIATGMIGSDIGIEETHYECTPVDLSDHSFDLVKTRLGMVEAHIVPGVRTAAPVPSIMRGEETTLVGLLKQISTPSSMHILPGTHSKCVLVEDGVMTQFITMMTGELYDLLMTESTLRTPAMGSETCWESFDVGVSTAIANSTTLGLDGTLFITRTQAILSNGEVSSPRDFLSGLLIGSEVERLKATIPSDFAGETILSAPNTLQERYLRVLSRSGIAAKLSTGAETSEGLYALAVKHGLLGE